MLDKAASIIWLDANGVTRQTVIKSASGAGAVWAAIQAVSRAQVMTSWESEMGAPVGAASFGSYQSCKTAARLYYQTGAGSIISLTVPAPDIGLFLPDKVTVDPASLETLAINAAAVGSITDGFGNVAVSYIGGTLVPGRNDLPSVA